MLSISELSGEMLRIETGNRPIIAPPSQPSSHCPHPPPVPPKLFAMASGGVDGQEDASDLSFPKEFEEAETLLISEVTGKFARAELWSIFGFSTSGRCCRCMHWNYLRASIGY